MPQMVKNANPNQGNTVYARNNEKLCLCYKESDEKNLLD